MEMEVAYSEQEHADGIRTCHSYNDLAAAARFDARIFAPPRTDKYGSEVAQPDAVTVEDYERMAAHGPVFYLIDGPDDSIVAVCAINLAPDPMAHEPILRNMDTDTAYCTVVATDPRFRGRGLANLLLRRGLDAARQAGMRKMVTTIHPTNVGSQKVFYANGFLGTGMVDAYYNLRGGSGRRLIMLNGDLQDPGWALSRATAGIVRRVPLTEAAHADFAMGFDAMSELYSPLLEMSYLAAGPVEYANGQALIPIAPFTGDELSMIAHWLYPYNSLREGYDTIRQYSTPHDHITRWIGSGILSSIDSGCGEYLRSDLPLMADSNRRMVEWLVAYHNAVQGGQASDGSTLYEGVLRSQDQLDEFRRCALEMEGVMLRRLLVPCVETSSLHDQLVSGASEEYLLSEKYVRDMVAANRTLYGQLPSTISYDKFISAYQGAFTYNTRRLLGWTSIVGARQAKALTNARGIFTTNATG
ncbi:MAG TPA: GNAT family N-acetyltransferase [Candidatus Saccharimonadales bacterium]